MGGPRASACCDGRPSPGRKRRGFASQGGTLESLRGLCPPWRRQAEAEVREEGGDETRRMWCRPVFKKEEKTFNFAPDIFFNLFQRDILKISIMSDLPYFI